MQVEEIMRGTKIDEPTVISRLYWITQFLGYKINQNAKNKGFWEKERNLGEMLLLAISELTEAFEEYRNGKALDYIYYHRQDREVMTFSCDFQNEDGTLNKPEGFPVEVADCIIRLLDTCYAHNVPLAQAIIEKMKYNETRPYKHGNKLA